MFMFSDTDFETVFQQFWNSVPEIETVLEPSSLQCQYSHLIKTQLKTAFNNHKTRRNAFPGVARGSVQPTSLPNGHHAADCPQKRMAPRQDGSEL